MMLKYFYETQNLKNGSLPSIYLTFLKVLPRLLENQESFIFHFVPLPTVAYQVRLSFIVKMLHNFYRAQARISD
jgi:hypothetical protein